MGVRFQYALLLALCLYVCFSCAKTAKKEKLPVGEKRLADIKKLAKRFSYVEFTPRTFRRLVANAPRPYHTIALFTSNSSQFKCPSCQRLEPEFRKLAKLYEDTISGDYDKAHVFFGIIELSECQEIFQTYKELVPALPLVVHIAPEENKEALFWTKEDTYALQPNTLQAESIAQWVMSKTKERIFLPRATTQTYGAYASIFFVVLVALRRYDLILQYRKHPMFWFACAMLVCVFTSVGTVYNWIRTPPLLWRDPRSGRFMFIYPSMRSQFVLEGVIVTSLIALCSGSFIMLTEYVPRMASTTTAKFVTNFITYLSSLFMAAWAILTLFRIKVRGYPL